MKKLKQLKGRAEVADDFIFRNSTRLNFIGKKRYAMEILKKFVNALVVLLLLFAAPLALCQGRALGEDIYQETREIARVAVWEDINSGNSCCASVAVLVDGNIVYSEGFGMADREKSVPVDDGTLFNMGSTSKAFCATAIMLLVEDGKVELDAPVTRYLPEFTMADPRYRDITVRILLNHTSGFPGTTGANNMGYDFNSTVYEDALENLSRSHLKAAPGAAAPYCNDGFTLAEMIVASFSGPDYSPNDYMDFLSERVFKPLSLSRTGRSVGQLDDQNIGGYYQADGKKVPREVVSTLGAGGLSTTAEDLVVFADSLSAGGRTVLSNESIAEMTKAQPSAFAKTVVKETGINPEEPFGLGLDITDLPSYKEKGIKVIGKGGDTDQYHSMMLCVPDRRISVAVLAAGTASSSVVAIAFDILDSVLEARGLVKEEKASPKTLPGQEPLPAKCQAFDGFYAGEPPKSFEVSFDSAWNTATVAIIEEGVVIGQGQLTYRDGHFENESGLPFWFMSAAGHDFFMQRLFRNTAYFVGGDQLSTHWSPQTLGIDIEGWQWLRRNVKPFEYMGAADDHITRSAAPPGLSGYIDFLGVKRIESPNFAGMVSSLIRDQTELILSTTNGQTWARVFDRLYSPVDTAVPLGKGDKTVTIGGEGYSEWLKADEQLVLTFAPIDPAKGRVIVFSPEGDPTQDSVIDTGEFLVPEGGFVEVAGWTSETFKLTAAPPAPEYVVLDSGDYNGDGLSEIAVFRPDTGLWAVKGVTRVYFGSAVDIPTSGDYDGDGVTDVAVFRPVIGLWAVKGVTRVYFGSAVDRPVPGDYDGDGTCNPAVFGRTSGRWAVRGLTQVYLGREEDLPVPGDYAGDGVKEIAIYRPSTGLWVVRGVTRAYFGSAGDRPVPAVYSSGNPFRTEIAVFRPATGLWAVQGITRTYFGGAGDSPAPGDFTGDSLDNIGIFRPSSGLWAVRGVTRAYFGTSGDIAVTR